MTTSWSTRTIPTSSWSTARIGGAYLTDVSGNYILTMAGERIIVLVPGGDLPNSSWSVRTVV